MEVITLSPAECKIADYIGRLRRAISLKYDRKDTRHNFTSHGLKNDIEAAGAELAVAKLLNVYPEWSPTPGAVPRFDLRWHGKQVDVKSTQASKGNLLIPYLDKSAVYILARGSMPGYEIAGCIDGKRVPEVGRWEELEHHACWLVLTEYLEPVTKTGVPA